MTFAIIPAAGKSVRMGRPKLALPLGDRTVVEHVLAALQQAKIQHILLVAGPQVAELAVLAEAAGAHVVLLDRETPDMRATVELGLQWLEEQFHPKPDDDWLLVPADHPTLDSTVIEQLLQARALHPQASIFIPTHNGQRGHPALIAWHHVSAMRAMPAGHGLNVYLRQHAAESLEVPVESPHILCDLDTPEDYEQLLRQMRPVHGS
jgi:molybdenum cofactor cytidylyltransferase